MISNSSGVSATRGGSRSWRFIVLAPIGALALAALLVACGSDPEPREERADTRSDRTADQSTPTESAPTVQPTTPNTGNVQSTRAPRATAAPARPTAESQPTAAPEPTPTPAGEQSDGPTTAAAPPPVVDGDYDADDDGLIEIRDVAQLDAIRYDTDGDGVADDDAGVGTYLQAFPDPAEGMGCRVGGCEGYELIADLDLDTNGNGLADPEDDHWNAGSGWEPIGYYRGSDDQRAFATTLQGDGHTIANLFISRPQEDYVGLFGFSSGGLIRDVVLSASDVTGHDYVGALVGNNEEGGRVIGCASDGTVTGNDFVGGLVGDDKDGGRISDSAASAHVAGMRYVGGLVGRVDGNFGSAARNSSAAGNVVGNDFVGGLVGFNDGSIEGGSASGNVSGNVNVGGLVGRGNGGEVINSLASGDVDGRTDIGGLIGRNDGDINDSRAQGSVTGQDNVGGLAGYNGQGDVSEQFRRGLGDGPRQRGRTHWAQRRGCADR